MLGPARALPHQLAGCASDRGMSDYHDELQLGWLVQSRPRRPSRNYRGC
jgi:hypothetical protein